MERLNKSFFIFCLLFSFLAVSCNTGSSEESTEETAEEINEENFSWEAEEDAEFVTTAYSFNLMLQEYGELAQQRANVPAPIMDFAKNSVDYHKNLNEQLSNVAQKSGIALPTAVGENVQDYMENLRDKDGEDFANAYIDVVTDIQDKMTDEYEDAADNAYDPGLRSWAAAELVKIRDREMLVDQLEEVTNEMD